MKKVKHHLEQLYYLLVICIATRVLLVPFKKCCIALIFIHSVSYGVRGSPLIINTVTFMTAKFGKTFQTIMEHLFF